MDESLEGILTVLCDHSFHTECLIKWPDIKCPVCRYIQSPTPPSSLSCTDCDTGNVVKGLLIQDIWMCLICGYLGCGRYENKHAFMHFEETAHTFSIKIGTSQVWDYAGDNYVHRLISCTDGKLVECSNEERDSLDNKIESLKLEYNHLLSFQLLNQREFYENMMKELSKTHAKELSKNSQLQKKEMEKMKIQLSKKVKSAKTPDSKNLEEERALNSSLISNIECLNQKVMDMEIESQRRQTQSHDKIKELEDQISDLMKHFEMSHTIQSLETTQQNVSTLLNKCRKFQLEIL
uniref:BRCA1-associated protein (Trinotate prediction) n=1 Tax=Myxobolus squamalis TaxID=59785 RepID=A0A6B2FVJ1_MYXSQ